MSIIKIFIVIILLIFSISANGQKIDKKPVMNSVDFPNFLGPIQLTDKPYEHFFASYYGINSFSANELYATVLRTTIKDHLPNENEPATLGIVDIRKKSFIPITKTHAWNFQQGCMAHWLSTNPDSLIIYNDLRNISSRFDKHFEGIKDLRKKLEQAMTATDGFGRDARSIMNTLSNIKDPQQVKETLEAVSYTHLTLPTNREV